MVTLKSLKANTRADIEAEKAKAAEKDAIILQLRRQLLARDAPATVPHTAASRAAAASRSHFQQRPSCPGSVR
jgi:hypothetical protein